MSCKVALIGFGEAGSTFARAGKWGAGARGFDILPERGAAMTALGISSCASAGEALGAVPLVLSLVTADQVLAAAQAYAPLLAPGTIWCDMNSVAPQTKRAAAAAIEAAGSRYVDVAMLAPVKPAELAMPLLLAGGPTREAQTALAGLGFTNIRIVGTEIGKATAIKMIRSIMVKGIEALTAEMMLAAEAAGVTDAVLDSLDASETRIGWHERAAYNLERMRTHGLRRAAEMEESVATLQALGIEPAMTRGTVIRQRDMARQSGAPRA